MIAARLSSALYDLQQSPLAQTGAKALERLLAKRQVPLESAIDAPRHDIDTADAGKISYYADTRAGGRPLVLLHGVHAAASAYDVRPLFEAFRQHRSVYALDLPGFGFSERSERPYTPAMYIHAIEHLLRNVAMTEPADVIALSLTSEYAAKVSVDMPELIRSLVFVSPTGFATEQEAGKLERFARRTAKAEGVTQLAELIPSRLLYELLVSRPSLRLFLGRSFESRVDAGLLDYAYKTSHQSGAWRAPFAFVTGSLFPTGSAQNVYAHVRAPSLVLYDQDAYTGFGALEDFVSQHGNFRSQRLTHTRGLPQFDAPQQTVEALKQFYDGLELRKGGAVFPLNGNRSVGSA
jgi:pimeloyl-ACP methyl ester carboxylesterase